MKTPSTKKRLLLPCYEMLRLVFILTFRPEFDIEMLPASWYMAAPLLVLPLMLVLFMGRASRPKEKSTYGKIYAFTKFLSVAGFFPFIKAALVTAVERAEITDFYSLKRMIFLLIFLVIDVILALVVLLNRDDGESERSPVVMQTQRDEATRHQQEEGEDSHADYSNSQR